MLAAAGIGAATSRLEALELAWREAVGRDTAARTRIQGLRGGVLTVLVSSSAVAQELMVYYKRDLLAQLRGRVQGPLTDLRCKVVGSLDDPR